MFNFDIAKLYKIEEHFFNRRHFDFTNLYTKIEDKITLEQLFLMQKEDSKNLDINFALSVLLFREGAVNKALKFADLCVFISNSYHSYFHYFGFNLGMKIWQKTGEEEFKKKALFFYPKGGSFEENGDFLPPYKDLCIFEGSTLHKNFYSHEENILKMTFEKSLKEHFNYHIASAEVFFLRGLIWKELNKPEIARVDLEKALKMEPKNPKNHVIEREIQKLTPLYV